MARMVNCVKLGRELPGLERKPYPGQLGQQIYENVSQQAWDMLMQHSVILINHYGLSTVNPEHQQFLINNMESFLFGQGLQTRIDTTLQGTITH